MLLSPHTLLCMKTTIHFCSCKKQYPSHNFYQFQDSWNLVFLLSSLLVLSKLWRILLLFVGSRLGLGCQTRKTNQENGKLNANNLYYKISANQSLLQFFSMCARNWPWHVLQQWENKISIWHISSVRVSKTFW